VQPAPQPRGVLHQVLGPVVVLTAATVLAGFAYASFLEGARHLWSSGIHDRNAHYWLGFSFALDIRNTDFVHCLRDIHAARVWPPLHAMLVGLVLGVGGLDYRLAVLPSLVAWVATAVLAYLCARRAVAQGGNFAGLTAALFVLASPAHRAFATDIMLESLGACLTLAVVYAFMVAMQERSPWTGRLLGLALTALFFCKYNYWLLVVLGVAVTAVAGDPRRVVRPVSGFLARAPWQDWLKRQLRHPLTYLLIPVLLLVLFAYCYGGVVDIAGRRISVNAPHNLVHIALLLLVVRVLPWYRRTGRVLVARLEAPARQLVGWHLGPIVVWFLWPQRLGYFLWYLTRDHGQEPGSEALGGGLAYYANCLGTDYHAAAWGLLLALALAAVAMCSWRSLRPGGAVVLWVALVAAAFTIQHPTHRSRFVHSWIAVGWVAAGIGLAQVVYGRQSQRRPEARAWLVVPGMGAVLVLAAIGTASPGHAPEGGPQADRPTVLDITDAYLAALDECRHPAVFASSPIKFLTGWTLMERRQRHVPLATEVKGFDGPVTERRSFFDDWLSTSDCDAIVVIDLPPQSVFYEPVSYPDYRIIQEWLRCDPRFTCSRRREIEPNGATVTVWRRVAQVALAK
jgi:hypothetical protein